MDEFHLKKQNRIYEILATAKNGKNDNTFVRACTFRIPSIK